MIGTGIIIDSLRLRVITPFKMRKGIALKAACGSSQYCMTLIARLIMLFSRVLARPFISRAASQSESKRRRPTDKQPVSNQQAKAPHR